MDFTCIFFGVIFATAGIIFFLGKGHIHLSAWKNMPQEEKEKLNIAALCHNIGSVIGLSGIIFLAKGLLGALSRRWFVIAMIGWLILAGLDVWHIGKSERYRSR